jgi:hypothetical protein
LNRQDWSEDDDIPCIVIKLVYVIGGVRFADVESGEFPNRSPCGVDRRFMAPDLGMKRLPGVAQRHAGFPL